MNKVYTYAYDAAYDPAMPVVDIQNLRQIHARRSRKKWMRGTTGERMLVDLYLISIQLGPFARAYLEAVGDTQNDEVIVGRDVLNHLSVNLNGPASAVEIAADAF